MVVPSCDLHLHSNWSNDADPTFSISQIVNEAKNKKYKYVAITDHSFSKKFLNKNAIIQYRQQCKDAENLYGVKVLCGIEIDIEKDGSLSWDYSILKSLDFVIGGIHHHHFTYVTERLLEAISSGLINVIAHPTNRINNCREESPINWTKVLGACIKYNVALEINGARNDPTIDLIKRGKEEGVYFTLGSDAHSLSTMNYINNSIILAKICKLKEENFLKIM